MDVNKILQQMDFDICTDKIIASQFKDDEDDSYYDVWKVIVNGKSYVLKRAKEYELEIYKTFLNNISNAFNSSSNNLTDSVLKAVPYLYKTINYQNKDYLLMEYACGEDLKKCDRFPLKLALDSLILLQDTYWENQEYSDLGYNYETSLKGRKNRGNFLKDEELEAAYEIFLKIYTSIPRTFCHDDLLPFNIIVSESKATIIDWEYAGILPYMTSFARLIAHGEEDKDAFFFMTNEDKKFAIQYYYDNLIKGKGIRYEDYLMTLDYFLLYEYCEWIMLGNKYEDADKVRYNKYFIMAKELVRKLNSI